MIVILWPVNWYFGTKYPVRFRQVSTLELVRVRLVLLYKVMFWIFQYDLQQRSYTSSWITFLAQTSVIFYTIFCYYQWFVTKFLESLVKWWPRYSVVTFPMHCIDKRDNTLRGMEIPPYCKTFSRKESANHMHMIFRILLTSFETFLLWLSRP